MKAGVQLHPTQEFWDWFLKRNSMQPITPLLVASSVADMMAGYHISHTAKQVLEDLKLLTPSGKPNKRAKLVVAHWLHQKFHNGKENGVILIEPDGACSF